jgi:hypothetical protein
METSWEIAPVLQEISDHAGRLLPLLDKLDARAWVEKGASDTYLAQVRSARDQARALNIEAKALVPNPERLSAGLQVLVRIYSLEGMLGSLADAVRRYQGPADAQTLAAQVAENGRSRNRLERYIVNLAAEREQDLQVMDREAQRCRSMVTQTPPQSGRKK